MKQIAVVTSGGDAPGINAAIRAVVRTGIDRGWKVFGVRHGYAGLMNDEFVPLGSRDVSGIIQRGGTILGSTRCPAFKAEDAQIKAVRFLREREIDALIVIGGDGSQAGAFALAQKEFPVVGVASTIDNDLFGSEITIGVDTALNVALEAIDRIKVTASSHERAFLVEVMGRNCGYLAMISGIAGGAECIVLPEAETDPEFVASELRQAYEKGKTHATVVVAEGAKYNAEGLSKYFKEHREQIGFDLRVVKLGHVQRGGTPGAFDRLLATRFGAAATEQVAQERYGMLVGLKNGRIAATPLAEIVGKRKTLELELLNLAEILAR
ncbi:MAG TPA: ATP-dependent 6-phosphofructokinase [Candidatus Solibacter sp.]|nr:ATP-dependent 6-phosphofructokinase [Candidatus Solibacter sp.]